MGLGGEIGLLTGILVLGLAACGAQAQKPADRPANRLSKETSPYLLQHAHNPVDWYPWGEEAFAKARRENKPVFLSVGYSACHWCHVMERESFEDESVGKLLNDHFVSIKVDREERPDVDEIYMSALLAMHGRGGWPMSVFLTPEGKPFSGGTYFPRDDFAERLRQIQALWSDPEQRKRVLDAGERAAQAIGRGGLRLPGGEVSPALLTGGVKSLLERLDPKHGGFGGAPKFPPSVRLEFLLAEQRRKPDPLALKAITLTLDQMARGGMYDQVGGGFHRYSVDEKWLVPHFEKMLYDNALLAGVYLEANRMTGNAYFRRIGKETLDFVLRELRDPAPKSDSGGAFWSALDADSANPEGEKEEGRFYTWTPAEVNHVLGEADGALFCRVYGITGAGNFEGRNIPNLLPRPVEAWAAELKTRPEALWARLDRMRAKLRAARAKRPRPFLDDKVLANWNGLMLRALATGYQVTGEARYREAAEQAAGFVLARMRGPVPAGPEKGPEGVRPLRHSYRAGKSPEVVFLEDYSFLSAGLLDLHAATGEKKWLTEAHALARRMVADFRDEEGKTLYMTPGRHEKLLFRPTSAEDSATPSGQGMAAGVLVRLGRLTGDTALAAYGRTLLESHASNMRLTPDFLPGMLVAVNTLLTPSEEPVVAAAGADPLAPGDPLLPGDFPGVGGEKEDPVTLSLTGIPKTVKPGQVFTVKVGFTIGRGWHINGEKPGDRFLLPTQVSLAPGPFKQLSVTFPPPKKLKISYAEKPVYQYLESMAVTLKVKALPGAEKPAAVRVNVRYQPCDEEKCLRPVNTTLSAPVNQ